MASGGLPANFSFKKRKGKKRKARKFDIGAQLRKEAQPVKIEKTAEEKAAEAVVTKSDWQEDPVKRRTRNSFKSKFGSIQKIEYVRQDLHLRSLFHSSLQTQQINIPSSSCRMHA